MKREGVDKIKGCQKKVVLIRSAKSPIFEEAYLIMREHEESYEEADIVREADRILSACRTEGKRKGRSISKREFFFFLAGLLSAGLVFGLMLGFAAIVHF